MTYTWYIIGCVLLLEVVRNTNEMPHLHLALYYYGSFLVCTILQVLVSKNKKEKKINIRVHLDIVYLLKIKNLLLKIM